MTEQPLVSIRLEDENSVPEVFYKGEKIDHKTKVLLEWMTQTDEFGGIKLELEHFEENTQQGPHLRSIHHNTGRYVMEDE